MKENKVIVSNAELIYEYISNAFCAQVLDVILLDDMVELRKTSID